MNFPIKSTVRQHMLLQKILPILFFFPASGVAGVKTPSQEVRKVFAHYIAGYSGNERFYEREIRLAKQYGIDGFALNCGEWISPGTGRSTRYRENSDRMYETAERTGLDFKLFLSPDGPEKAWRERGFSEMVERYYTHPSQYRREGKLFLSGWGATPEVYQKYIMELKRRKYEIFLCPTGVIAPEYPVRKSPFMIVKNVFYPGSVLDGIFTFACDGPPEELVRQNSDSGFAAVIAGKIHMAGAAPAYNSPNLRDFGGLYGYAMQWEGILRDSPELVELVTWNDYGEDTALIPHVHHWFRKDRKRMCTRDESALDMTAYYANAYRTGIRPDIPCDKAYLTFRDRPKTLTRVWVRETSSWGDVRFSGKHPEQIHNDVQDRISLTVFLTAPALVEIIQGSSRTGKMLPAGLGVVHAPMLPGEIPCARISRDGTEILSFYGPKQILREATRENSPAGLHLTNRVWSAGGISVPGKYVFHPDPGGKWEIDSIPAGSYAVRIFYRNSSREDALRTLKFHYAEPEKGTPEPYILPISLPPTKGKTVVTSRLWTLQSGGQFLSWEKETGGDAPDFGEAELIRLELAPNPIFQSKRSSSRQIPKLVFFSGDGKIPPFSLGKFEVTNQELEEVIPEHRKLRCEFSWRDREPAVQVSWFTAVRCCNLYSRRCGLIPWYDEKTMEVVPGANGFRLPTEAEWEFAAKRGSEKMRAGTGNLRREKGVAVVGSYPEDMTRDGIFDLSGNVAEWCHDKFYPDDLAGKKPDDSPYRSIRGGSWTYYNSDGGILARDGNHPGYGGYSCIGFRIAVGKEGTEILKQKGLF